MFTTRARIIYCRLQFTLHRVTGKRSVSLTALVTGGNRGIGLQVCKQLTLKGHKVIMGTRKLEKGLAAVEKHFDEETKDRVDVLQLDISESSSIADAVKRIQNKYNSIDVLVNNAGINLRTSPNSIKMVKETLQTNYYGTIELTEAILPLLTTHRLQSSLSSYVSRIITVSNRDAALYKLSAARQQQLLSADLDEKGLHDLMELYQNTALKNMSEVGCNGNDADDEDYNPTTKQGWLKCPYLMAYVGLNQYCRILGKRFSENNDYWITTYCPGHCASDSTDYFGARSTAEGAYGVYTLATMLLEDDTIPNGTFCSAFYSNHDLESIDLEVMDFTQPSQTVSWDALCANNISLETSNTE